MSDAKKTDRMQEGQNAEEARRREGAMRLFGALSGVDEEYLAACESEKGGKVLAFSGFGGFARRYGMVFAAALCLAVLGIGYLTLQTAPRAKNLSGSMGINGENGMAFAFMPREGGAADDADGMEPEAAAEAAGAEVLDTEQTTDQIQNAPSAASKQDECKRFTGEVCEEDSFFSENRIDETESLGTAKSGEEMTLEQAGRLAVVGEYLPDVWPARGKITRLVGEDTVGAEWVSVTWSYANQWDSFVLSVENLGEELPAYIEEAVADQEKPETYDENLYEIPYAETLPKEYLTVFQDPVFAGETFDKDCVRARLISPSGDSGDTGTPRGRFRILYREGDNYVLVRFNGRGTVDEIWDLLSSMEGR